MLFLFAIILYSFAQSIVDSTFNNYLNETFRLTNFQRGFLEVPREFPGFLAIFISALLFFLCSRKVAALANFLCAVGIFLIGLISINFSVLLCWLFIFSIGQHLFLPLNSSIGMELAKDGKTGKRLGQLNGLGNFAAIIGSFIIFIGFKFLKFNFTVSFTIASIGYIACSAMIFFMKPDKPMPAKTKFVLKKEYKLFYWLNVLYGTRKQIFLTFAPWVLVTVFNQKTQVVATLLTIGGVIGIGFKPLLGRLIDRLGEKIILAGEAVVLVFVCAGYGFGRELFPGSIGLYIAFGCYISDQLLMSVSMARATYFKKIAVHPDDVAQTLTMCVSIDHVFSITIAVASGIIWKFFGYQYVFLMGAAIAVINFVSTMFIKIPSGVKAEENENIVIESV